MSESEQYRYRVYGVVPVTVSTVIESDTPLTDADVLELAINALNSLDTFVGNGGTNKMCGVCGEEDFVNADAEISWDEVYRI